MIHGFLHNEFQLTDIIVSCLAVMNILLLQTGSVFFPFFITQ